MDVQVIFFFPKPLQGYHYSLKVFVKDIKYLEPCFSPRDPKRLILTPYTLAGIRTHD
jgi:hypothetical protein